MVLSLLIENQSSYREIQTGLKSQHGLHLSLGKIAQIVQEAGKRARAWLESQRADHPRALALDEQYGSQQGHAYLNVIDVHSGQVWMTIPPVHKDEKTRLAIALRHATRKKEGKGVTRRPVKRSLSEQQEHTALVERVAEGVRYLSQEIRSLSA